MQSNWPGLPNWVFSKVVESSALSSSSESEQSWSRSSSSSSPGSGAGSQPGHLSSSATTTTSTSGQISTPSTHFNFTPNAGKAAIGGGLAAVLQAAGGFFRFLGGGGPSGKPEKRPRGGQRHLKQVQRGGTQILKFGGAIGNYGHHHMDRAGATTTTTTAGAAASLLLNRVTSLVLENLGKIRKRNALPTAVAALLPPITDTQANFLSFPGEVGLGKPCMIEDFEETVRSSQRKVSRRRQAGDGVIVEPKTGFCFPVQLGAATGKEDSSCGQVLAGVGARAQTFMKLKSIMIYSFGLYVQPDQLREKIGERYAGVPPEELKHRPDFYDDLLSHEVDMTVRLVVHYKGLKMGMVRSAFESSLKSRLIKIKGAEKDSGLQDFCSLMSEDVVIFRGTTIDFRWQPGGALQTEIGGRKIGTIFSPHLCRAFFAMYIGDPPVSVPAKLAIGESFARLLSTCSTPR